MPQKQNDSPKRPSDTTWDPFADDLVVTPDTLPTNIEVHAVRNLAKEQEIAGQLAAETVTKPAIIPESAAELPPLARPEPFRPIRSATLPDEKLVRSPQKLDSSPSDDLYAIVEEQDIPAVPTEPVSPPTPHTAATTAADRPSPSQHDPWKEIFEDEAVPAAWRKPSAHAAPSDVSNSQTERGTNVSGTTNGAAASSHTKVTANIASNSTANLVVNQAVPPAAPPTMGLLRETAVQRQVEQLEKQAEEKLRRQEVLVAESDLSTREFFRQGPVLRRILIVAVWGIALRGLFQISFGEGIIGQITTMLVTYMCGGFCLVFFTSYLMQTLRGTFEMAFNHAENVDDWPFDPFMEGIFSLAFPIVAFFGTFLFIIPVLSTVAMTSFALSWISVPIQPILVTSICVPILFGLVYPLCYMNSLANNDALDVIPITVWRTRHTMWRRVGRFYLEQIGISLLSFGTIFLIALCGEISETLFVTLSLLVTPPVTIVLAMLYHERLGRLCADLALAERELIKKKKK